MNRIATFAFFVSMGAAARPALAHRGHGVSESGGLLHYVVEPIHLGGLLLVAVAVLVFRVLRVRRAR